MEEKEIDELLSKIGEGPWITADTVLSPETMQDEFLAKHLQPYFGRKTSDLTLEELENIQRQITLYVAPLMFAMTESGLEDLIENRRSAVAAQEVAARHYKTIRLHQEGLDVAGTKAVAAAVLDTVNYYHRDFNIGKHHQGADNVQQYIRLKGPAVPEALANLLIV